jgi:hypothetical protein
MKTDDFVNLLAANAAALPSSPGGFGRRFAGLVAVGVLASALVMALEFGIRTWYGSDLEGAMFWVRLAFVGLVGASGLAMTWRLAHPGLPVARWPLGVWLPLVTMAGLAVQVLAAAPAEARSSLIFGSTWKVCTLNIVTLAVPVFAALVVALRSAAPTNLRGTGAAAGFAAGGLGALVYTLHCPELAAPFLAIWYALGMLVPAALGALLGPRLLRW